MTKPEIVLSKLSKIEKLVKLKKEPQLKKLKKEKKLIKVKFKLNQMKRWPKQLKFLESLPLNTLISLETVLKITLSVLKQCSTHKVTQVYISSTLTSVFALSYVKLVMMKLQTLMTSNFKLVTQPKEKLPSLSSSSQNQSKMPLRLST